MTRTVTITVLVIPLNSQEAEFPADAKIGDVVSYANELYAYTGNANWIKLIT